MSTTEPTDTEIDVDILHDLRSLEPIVRLNRDMIAALRREFPGGVTDSHARFLVDVFHTTQKTRIRLNNQIKGLARDAKATGHHAEPSGVLESFHANYALMERNAETVLKYYVQTHPMFWFFENTLGVGPILAAELLAHIAIWRSPTVGHIYSFAGLNPQQKWAKGARRPWNASLKTACWKIGQSFIKLSGRADSFYSQVYKQAKVRRWQKNLAGGFRNEAQASLAAKNYGAETDQVLWYGGKCSPDLARDMLEAGETPTAKKCLSDAGTPMLSPGHINNQAAREAVKLFLSHLHECWYEQEVGTPPAPFAIAIQGHAHYVPPPQKARPAAQVA